MQLYVLFTRKLFLITFSVLLIINIDNFIRKAMSFNGIDKYYLLPSSLAFSLNWSFDGRIVIYVVAIFAALPFASSYAEDCKARLSPAIFSRTSSYNYYFSKLAVVFCSTFICIAIPFIINQLLCMAFFPIENITSDHSLSSSHSPNYFMALQFYSFKYIYLNNIHLYDFIYTLIFSTFWGLVSAFSCAISFCLAKLKALVIIIPFLLFQLAFYADITIFGTSLPNEKLFLNFADYILPQSFGLCASPIIFFLYIFLFVTLSVGIVIFKVRAERVNSN